MDIKSLVEAACAVNRNETHCGCYFIVVIMTEMKINFEHLMLCKQ